MVHSISYRTTLCVCAMLLCFKAAAQSYVTYNHDATKMNQIRYENFILMLYISIYRKVLSFPLGVWHISVLGFFNGCPEHIVVFVPSRFIIYRTSRTDDAVDILFKV